MKTRVIDGSEWGKRLVELPRIGTHDVTAFYEHRMGAICQDARYLLVPLDDHLVHRGDGIFESLALTQGKILELDAHMARLQRSAETLKIIPPLSWDCLREIIIDVAKTGNAPNGSLKVLMGRGEGGMGVSPKECPLASFYCVASKSKPLPESFWEKGLTACRSKLPAKHEFMAQIKSTNYLPNVLMTQEAEERGVKVSLSFDIHGYLAEAAIANVGLIDADGVFVLPHFRYALSGTTALLAKSLAEQFLPVAMRDISEEEIFKAKELFILGTGPECVAITHYEGKVIGDGTPGAVGKKIRKLLHDALLDGGTVFMDANS